MGNFESVVNAANSIIWSNALIYLLLLIGIFFSIRMRLFQVRTFERYGQKPAIDALKDYEKQKAEGKDPVFNPVLLGIKNADFWEHEYPNDTASPNKE